MTPLSLLHQYLQYASIYGREACIIHPHHYQCKIPTYLYHTEMATLDSLKQALRQTATATVSSPAQALSDEQYSAGFNILIRGSGWLTYQDFVIPQLSHLLVTLFNSCAHVSVLEIGPGSKSVFGYLPSHLRQKIRKYTAFEPNSLFATELEEWLLSTTGTESPMPCLETPPKIHRLPFVLQDDMGIDTRTSPSDDDEKYDIVLFCHSLYGMNPKRRSIERALQMLVEQPRGGVVVIFHRDEVLHLDGLVCQQTASFPTGTVSVADDDEVLDCFAPFVAGMKIQDVGVDSTIRVNWRQVCRTLGRREETHTDCLLFSAPDLMAVFTRHATTLPELTARVPLVTGDKTVKNREARLHFPATMIRPTEVPHVQECVEWALRHGVGLTVVSGGHSGHCLWPNVLSVDMGAFDRVHVITARNNNTKSGFDSLVVAETGCKTGDIVRRSMAAGLTVPLGARPSVGAGLWLQGGIGHLARLHGLACDAIVGAVVVSVECGQVYCVGLVPSQYWPDGAVRPAHETDLLWAVRGAGTNFGIVISVTFKAYAAPIFSVRNWALPLKDKLEARLKLNNFSELASKLARNCSADAYLYWDNDQLSLGVTMLDCSMSRPSFGPLITTPLGAFLGSEDSLKVVDNVGLFDTEMYISGMHGGHGGGKTSSFKRCLFLKHVGREDVSTILVAAIEIRPSPLCYLHLLQGGGATGDVTAGATAFGCRDWEFACVITGVWPRDQDGSDVARAAVQWVYSVAEDLLPLSSGAYGADLGPDPRDASLAAKAFGPNQPRLARLKQIFDPHGVLAYACPLVRVPVKEKLIILITGESCTGKDYCADLWVSVLASHSLTARAVSISDGTKREYAATTGADLNRLLEDRAYKEKHRPALMAFFQSQVRLQNRLPEQQFLNVVYGAADVEVLLITGMRDEAPVAAFSHLVPESRLLEVRIKASDGTRRARRKYYDDNDNRDNKDENGSSFGLTTMNSCPSLTFDNDNADDEAVQKFAEKHLLPFAHEDLQQLRRMVFEVPDFPRPGIEFRHVLGISQQPGGLKLCTTLLQTHFTSGWAKVDAMVWSEVGGFVYAWALGVHVDVRL